MLSTTDAWEKMYLAIMVLLYKEEIVTSLGDMLLLVHTNEHMMTSSNGNIFRVTDPLCNY